MLVPENFCLIISKGETTSANRPKIRQYLLCSGLPVPFILGVLWPKHGETCAEI